VGPSPSDILKNSSFANGLQNWDVNGCKGSVCQSMENPKVSPYSGKNFVVLSQRTDFWSGMGQIISDRIELETMYDVVAIVRVSGPNSDLRATLNVQEADNSNRYVTLGRYHDLHYICLPHTHPPSALHSTVWICFRSRLRLETCWSNTSVSYNNFRNT
jgi:hypothetical protein